MKSREASIKRRKMEVLKMTMQVGNRKSEKTMLIFTERTVVRNGGWMLLMTILGEANGSGTTRMKNMSKSATDATNPSPVANAVRGATDILVSVAGNVEKPIADAVRAATGILVNVVESVGRPIAGVVQGATDILVSVAGSVGRPIAGAVTAVGDTAANVINERQLISSEGATVTFPRFFLA